MIKTLKELVFPLQCLVCDLPGKEICGQCSKPWIEKSKITTNSNLKIYYSATYNSVTSPIILGAKEESNRVAQQIMATSFYRSLLTICDAGREREIALLPIPSSRSSVRRRGGVFLRPILKIVKEMIGDLPCQGISILEALEHSRSVKDQTRLREGERISNLAGAFKVKSEIGVMKGRELYLIDDVMTTGATLISASQALSEINLRVSGGIVACISERKMRIR